MPPVWSYDIAVTVTLPERYKRMSAELQLEHTKTSLLECFDNMEVSLVAELTQNYDIHYHGICRVPIERVKHGHVLRYVKDRLRKFGFVCVKQVEDYPGWVEYLKKDIRTTIKEHRIYPIVKDDYDILERLFREVPQRVMGPQAENREEK